MRKQNKSGKKTLGKVGKRRLTKRRILPTLDDVKRISSHWILPGCPDLISEPCFGFIYKVVRKADGKYYIGMKQFNKKDWPFYLTSAIGLKSEIQETSIDYLDYFDFEMLFTCSNKSTLRLAEIELQLGLDVIHDNNCYNTHIGHLLWAKKNKHTVETKTRIRRILC